MKTDSQDIRAMLFGLAFIIFHRPLGRWAKEWQEMWKVEDSTARYNSIGFLIGGVIFTFIRGSEIDWLGQWHRRLKIY